MRRALTAALMVAAILGTVTGRFGDASGASSGPQPTGWDGTNPFACQLQHAGTGATVAHPEADPFCVDYDKTHQNVDQLGVVDFLSKEPARVALATPKCFYFQSDHWRGSVIQSNGATKTYEWDGHYFFNKATGEGGAWVGNFNVNGHTGDPSAVPGFPPGWARYFGPGTGGVIVHDDLRADPSCAARAQAAPHSVYAPGVNQHGTASAFACATPTGRVDASHLGPVALGDSERRVRRLLGAPRRMRRGFLRYCQRGAGKYLVGFAATRRQPSNARPGRGSTSPTLMLLTTNAGYHLHGVRRGSPARLLRARFPHARLVARQARTRVWVLAPRSSILAGVRHGRVRFLAVYERRAIRGSSALKAFLRRSQ